MHHYERIVTDPKRIHPPAGAYAHGIKTSRAASIEAARTDTMLPLQAVARLLDSPRLERFVAANVARSIEFLAGRAPRDE